MTGIQSHIALQSGKAGMRITDDDKQEQQELGVLARTVTADHSHYCTFGVFQNQLGSMSSIVHVASCRKHVIPESITSPSLQYVYVST